MTLIDLIRIVADTGMFILIWIVQLVVYPGFLFYEEVDLKNWHQRYTQNISIIVLPLMLTQLIIAFYQVWHSADLISVSYCILVIATWTLTFLVSVPLHRKIDQEQSIQPVLKKLVLTNWPRTALWTAIFFVTFVTHLAA